MGGWVGWGTGWKKGFGWVACLKRVGEKHQSRRSRKMIDGEGWGALTVLRLSV